MTSPNCTGLESMLQSCQQSTHTCASQYDVGVICQGKNIPMLINFTFHLHFITFPFSAQSVTASNCSDGEVRLVGGANITLGVVEVCINNAWGTVCNTRFGTDEAKVICKQLQFNPGIIS